MARRARRNPGAVDGLTLALGFLGVAAAGGTVYYVTKPKAAATTAAPALSPALKGPIATMAVWSATPPAGLLTAPGIVTRGGLTLAQWQAYDNTQQTIAMIWAAGSVTQGLYNQFSSDQQAFLTGITVV